MKPLSSEAKIWNKRLRAILKKGRVGIFLVGSDSPTFRFTLRDKTQIAYGLACVPKTLANPEKGLALLGKAVVRTIDKLLGKDETWGS